jgi:acyl dehydratase
VLRADVLETRTSQSKPTLCILRWRWRLFNQHGVEVLDVEAASLFDPFARRKASALMKAVAPG